MLTGYFKHKNGHMLRLSGQDMQYEIHCYDTVQEEFITVTLKDLLVCQSATGQDTPQPIYDNKPGWFKRLATRIRKPN